jgi:hypothetical protein
MDFLHGQKRIFLKTKDEIYQSGNFKSNFNQMVKFTEDILKI